LVGDACSRRAFRGAAISASISTMEIWSTPRRLALSHDSLSHSGGEGKVRARMLNSSFSAIALPRRLSKALNLDMFT
jgi:hypothetical protein